MLSIRQSLRSIAVLEPLYCAVPTKIMNKKLTLCSGEPADELVRDYAYHLYLQSGQKSDRDLDNWLEAKACLIATIPISHAHVRLHRSARNSSARKGETVITIPEIDPKNIAA
jgi:hypothetical protein